MPASSRLGAKIEEIVAALNAISTRLALTGGSALASHKVIRGTSDVDFFTDAKTHKQSLRKGFAWDIRVCLAPRKWRATSEATNVRASWTSRCVKPPDPKEGNRPPDVIATEGGTTVLIESARDPYEHLDDLMVVIEALCPRYPDREPFTGNEIFRL